MAEGGRLTRSVIGSSDVIYDFSCTPCAEDGKNTEAVIFCVNCDTYFCKTCIGHHNKVFKTHIQKDKTAMGNVGQQPKQVKTSTPLPNRDCDEHPGNVIQMYCDSHNVACCTVCIAMEHRSCNGIEFIPKLAKGIMQSTERQVAKTALEKLRREVLYLKFVKTKEITDLKKMKDDIMDKITTLKSQMIEKALEMEKKSTGDVNTKYKEIVEKIENDIDSLNTMLRSTETLINGINDNQSNESNVFVAVKGGQNLEISCKSSLQQLKDVDAETLSFEHNGVVKYFLTKVGSFGTIETTNDNNDPYSVTIDGEYNVKVSDDKTSCTIYDICSVNNNQFVISDFNNDKIKMLDQTFSATETCKMHGPWGICKTSDNELAVTLWAKKQIQFVSIVPELSCTRYFSTDEYCRGIKYNNSSLFISCGANGQSGAVKVYSLSGSVLRTYKTDTTGHAMFSWTAQLALSSHVSQIFICDKSQGLIILDGQGNQLSVVTRQNLNNVFGVCTAGRNKLFVCGNNSNNIFQLDRNDGQLQEILTQSDGIREPVSVTFVRNPTRLIVSFLESDRLKVFKLI